MERYMKVKIIGSGTFGSAWLAESSASGRKYAIKELSVSVMNDPDQRAAMNEVRILAQLKHKNIVRYKEAFVDGGKLHIVMEYAEKGDLYTRIRNNNGKYFTEQQVIAWFTQLCLALKYIHSQNILHRDLKTQNIFLTKEDVIKLGDFGIARILDSSIDHAHTTIGTPYYLSPEICQRKPYNHKSDMWSLGCVLYEVTTLKHAFDSDNFSGLVIKIVQGEYPPIPKFYGPLLEDLISVLLRTDPDSRPSAKQILYVPAMKTYVEKFVSFSRERTDSVSSDISSVSTLADREQKVRQQSGESCAAARANSVASDISSVSTLADREQRVRQQSGGSCAAARTDSIASDISSVSTRVDREQKVRQQSGGSCAAARTNSVALDISNVSTLADREQRVRQQTGGSCAAAKSSLVKQQATGVHSHHIGNRCHANSKPNVIGQSSQVGSANSERHKRRSRGSSTTVKEDRHSPPQQKDNAEFNQHLRQREEIAVTLEAGSLSLDPSGKSCKRTNATVKTTEEYFAAEIKSRSSEDETKVDATHAHSRFTAAPGYRKHTNYNSMPRHRALSVFDDKCAPPVNVRKRVWSEHVEKSVLKKRRERNVTSAENRSLGSSTGANVSVRKCPGGKQIQKEEDEKENNVQCRINRCDETISRNKPRRSSYARPFQSHNQNKTPVQYGVTSNNEPGIRKRTYTISSDRRESQFGEIPDINKDRIGKNSRSKSESGVNPHTVTTSSHSSFSKASAQRFELPTGVKKVNVSSSSAIQDPTHDKHYQPDHPSMKIVFCGKTLDLDNVSSADSAFTRMESIRVFLESHLGYELFVKAYECIKGVSAWDKEIAVCRLATEILGRKNMKYFPVLIQLVAFESIYYS